MKPSRQATGTNNIYHRNSQKFEQNIYTSLYSNPNFDSDYVTTQSSTDVVSYFEIPYTPSLFIRRISAQS